jgi:hypothetical protein
MSTAIVVILLGITKGVINHLCSMRETRQKGKLEIAILLIKVGGGVITGIFSIWKMNLVKKADNTILLDKVAKDLDVNCGMIHNLIQKHNIQCFEKKDGFYINSKDVDFVQALLEQRPPQNQH